MTEDERVEERASRCELRIGVMFFADATVMTAPCYPQPGLLEHLDRLLMSATDADLARFWLKKPGDPRLRQFTAEQFLQRIVDDLTLEWKNIPAPPFESKDQRN